MTDQILPEAFQRRGELQSQGPVDLVGEFLVENFGVPASLPYEKARYPGLPLLLSLVDTAIHRGDAFRREWPVERMRELRESVEDLVFELIELMSQDPAPYYDSLVASGRLGDAPVIVSLNYDLLADYALMRAAENRDGGARFPDYGCDVRAVDGERATFGTLLKIHGSLNWLYCPTCHHLEVGLTSAGAGLALAHEVQSIEAARAAGALCTAVRGGEPCGTRMRHVLITPSHMKDYRNPHIASIWQRAEAELLNAERVVLIGYSLPWDDVEVIYLLRRGLAHLAPDRITVVEHSETAEGRKMENHDAGKRYRAVFGDVAWRCDGFEDWVKHG